MQRHRARRLHYDFRLEIDGVLASWAVPKGPTLDPGVRRAAIHVEDHPLEYFDFEGVIPAGEYGGGDVIVWDLGSWEPHGTDDPGAAVAAGELHVDLHGEKLRGRFVLIRTGRGRSAGGGGGGAGGDGGKEQWLLLHKHDDDAIEGWDPEDHPRSVLSGRTNDEVRADPYRQWRSGLPADQASQPVRRSAASPQAAGPGAGDPEAAGPGAAGSARRHIDPAREAELLALDTLGSGGMWEVFGRQLRVTNLDKVLFPPLPGEEPVTKRDLLRYSATVAPLLVSYLAGRALNMHRFPNGAGSPGFWHKELPSHAPKWLPRWDNPEAKAGESRTYLVVEEPAALLWAANFGAIEWHGWTSRVDRPDLPDYALIDLDPGEGTSWEDLLILARLHRTALDHLGVRARAKVTGRRGMQIWIPIERGPTFEATRGWVEQLSRTVGAVVPELVSWKWNVTERGGRARLDYTQNVRNKTLVAPYSPRPAPGAPVSAPIDWEELDDPDLRPDAFTIRSVGSRIAERGDLFDPVLDHDQRLPPLA
ncbi:hypothetical protein K6U06_08730 [Acidiferrimicrobium sp. IK]|nr:hypothetical protein [Acidiferrimicrobium sp. IK]